MQDSSSNDSKENPVQSGITRYSNDLIKRSFQDIIKFSSLNLTLRKPKVLLVADEDLGEFIIKSSHILDLEITRIESYGQSDVIFFELSSYQYQLIILSNTLTSANVLAIVPEIRKRFPRIKSMVITGDLNDDYIKELWKLNIDGILSIPIQLKSFLDIIAKHLDLSGRINPQEEIIIHATKKTPEVNFDQSGIITIKGSLIPELSWNFFEPLERWITDVVFSKLDIITIDIKLEYINGDSTKYFLMLLSRLSYARASGKTVNLNWCITIDNEDIYEKAKQFTSLLDYPLNINVS